MRRGTVNLVVDLISFVGLLLLVLTGAVMKWVLPPGSGGRGYGFRGGRGSTDLAEVGPGEVKDLCGMTRHEWGAVHFYLAIVFVALMVIHLILHWSWIKSCVHDIFAREECEHTIPE